MSGDTLSYLGDRSLLDAGVQVAPYVVLALECNRPSAPPERLSLASMLLLEIGRADSRDRRRDGDQLRVDVPDGWMSSVHCTLRRDGGGWWVEDRGSKNGTFVNGTAIAGAYLLSDGDLLEVGSTMVVFRDPPQDRFAARAFLRADEMAPMPEALRTLSPMVDRYLSGVARIAPSEVSVIIRGETGTGKELVAQAIHQLSGRPGRFVGVNCGAIAEGLVESELFGHVKGAFSGAGDDKVGLVRAAEGGTLFLDEVAELPEPSQVALLRVLQEREVRPVGASETVAVDLRVVCATHRDLAARAQEGSFREDLYARLAGVTIEIPPLRERREDLGLLIGALLPRVCADADAIAFSRDAARALFVHDWPRNVRELEHALRAAVLLADGKPVGPMHLPSAVRGDSTAQVDGLAPEDQLIRDRVVELLVKESGNVRAVARAMDKAPLQVYRWAKRLGIEIDRYRD